jgi:hypothetical protein
LMQGSVRLAQSDSLSFHCFTWGRVVGPLLSALHFYFAD